MDIVAGAKLCNCFDGFQCVCVYVYVRDVLKKRVQETRVRDLFQIIRFQELWNMFSKPGQDAHLRKMDFALETYVGHRLPAVLQHHHVS